MTAAPAQRKPRRSLRDLVILANASVFLAALAVLASTPLTVTWPEDLREAVVLMGAVAVTFVVQALLVRHLLSPLGELWGHMQRVDPLRPGQRIAVRARTVEVADLVDAFNGMLDRLEAERRDSARRAQAAQDAERRWLSLELHDQIGQDLTAMVLGIDVARRVEGRRQAEALAAAAETAGDCLARVREIVARLRPAALDELGLASAVLQLCDRTGRASGMDVTCHVARGLPVLSPDAQLGVFRVAQECLTNAARHSAARRVLVCVGAHDGGVRLTVADDGVGLPSAGALHGSGVRGMRERALLLGASLTIAPGEPRGTTVTLEIPAAEVASTPPSLAAPGR